MSPCVRSAPSRPTRRRRKSCEDSGNRSPCFRNLLKSFSCAICRNTSLRPESDAGVGETVPWETVLAEALARLPHGDHLDRLIESDPAVMLGKPVIRGTRITVELILCKLGAGETMEQIIESHPRLTSEQIQAALAYAAESLARSVTLAEDWDRKMGADIREGRLDGLAEEALEDLREGRCTDLPRQSEAPLRDDTTEPT